MNCKRTWRKGIGKGMGMRGEGKESYQSSAVIILDHGIFLRTGNVKYSHQHAFFHESSPVGR
jgi:hypothetical protein